MIRPSIQVQRTTDLHSSQPACTVLEDSSLLQCKAALLAHYWPGFQRTEVHLKGSAVRWTAWRHTITSQKTCILRSIHTLDAVPMSFPCYAMPCHAAKGLECVFPIWFTQCGRVWFTLAMPWTDHAVLLKATAQHGRRETAVLCFGLEENGMIGSWHGHGMAWQVWIRHGRTM